MTYPIPFRQHVLSVRAKEDLTFEETSERFCVGIASLKRWSKRISPKPYDRKKVRKLDPDKLAQDVLALDLMSVLRRALSLCFSRRT